MSSKRAWQIVGQTIFWCAVVAFFIFAGLLRRDKESSRRIERVEIVVKDGSEASFITPEIGLDIIARAGLNPVGKSLDSVDLAKINRAITSYSFTRKAITYVDYNGTLKVELTQRQPLVRIITTQGHNFYLTRDMWVLPVLSHTTQNLPIVTGSLHLPFGTNFEGNLNEWLNGEEKKYRESYNFLAKLINFVSLTETSPQWNGKIVQIVLHHKEQGESQQKRKNNSKKNNTNASTAWQEPEVEIIPRHGNYSIHLGTLTDVEAKLDRWQRFVEAGVVELNEGGTLSVEYDGQALWTPPATNQKGQKKK